jgi:hypothetical protein
MSENVIWLDLGQVIRNPTTVLKINTLRNKVYKKWSDCKWREKVEY